ncbi:glutathione S-transferase T3-like [Brassica napus]|uniref:glutathione S-transferase T3-like n=1 Tax=Brassica napus TaxID=3708 RepID=UPI00207AC14F|nr:glutathione S-transferase T3-like [Brassica napus]
MRDFSKVNPYRDVVKKEGVVVKEEDQLDVDVKGSFLLLDGRNLVIEHSWGAPKVKNVVASLVKTPTEDAVLISAWLNTSKDPVVSNEQKASSFCKRIATYFAASPKVERGDKRGAIQCKQRWQKINDLVCKFDGSYDAVTRLKTSGQNDNDVVKAAHEIFYNDYKVNFTLQYVWEELRYDQKWCEVATCKMGGTAKKRKCDDGVQSSSSQATTNQGEPRPPGVKASKRGSAKRTNEDLSEFQRLWTIKEKDLASKEKLKKMDLLDTLIAKKKSHYLNLNKL